MNIRRITRKTIFVGVIYYRQFSIFTELIFYLHTRIRNIPWDNEALAAFQIFIFIGPLKRRKLNGVGG